MRRGGWLLSASLTPFVILGAVLTISIFGAIFGVPLLLVVGRPWWIGTMVGLARKDAGALTALERTHLLGCAVLIVVAALASLVVGFDDLDSGADAAWIVVLAALVLGTAIGTIRVLRSNGGSPPPSV